jgi:hypothetical protein
MGQIHSLSFLPPGNFPDDDPYAGLEETLRLFEYGERPGFDGARIRQRHLFPYEFSHLDYQQILHDVVHAVAPRPGWQPAAAGPGAVRLA